MQYKQVINLPKEDENFKSDWLDGYEQGGVDMIQNLLNLFDYDLFLKYSNDDRFISFNNLSLMIKEIVDTIK